MERFDIYKDISERTQGDIYVGVVGPVRTGKSTFIKRFMDLLVIPNIDNVYRKERTKDELPQSGKGKTIMTTEPKFVPNEAIEIALKDNARFNVRMIDCVGYLVKGSLGYEEEGMPRMVMTPWFENEIPFEEAAEIGTKKVITDHSTIGLMVTTDGSITDINRQNYIEAEERVVRELKDLRKPFVILLNSIDPSSEEAMKLKSELEEKYNVPVIPINCARMEIEDINTVLQKILFEFPVREISINLPKWIEGLDPDHWLKNQILHIIKNAIKNTEKIKDVDNLSYKFEDKNMDVLTGAEISNIDLGKGIASVKMNTKEGLFYEILQELTGYKIEGDHQLLSLMKSFSKAKKEYDRVEEALNSAKNLGYGVVPPILSEMQLEEPEIFKQGNRFGVKLRANAPSLHLIRADITTEVSPLVGSEKQSEDLLNYLMKEFENDPKKIWETNMFGKSLHDLVNEQLNNKLFMMPEDVRFKLQNTLQKIIDEGSRNLICIII
ncbi:stage IV sporulation protein A [Paramaledivibacter caminithermalis]|jgi:stage IV sporulation protein A|uniref:Stage IV sporulation protein A n=1 Tax=Paramaledivibacter caminithermalis (strain DSM 15212 / CIP 107654 / DViRD3) TaxID=1121301 RepID=A0A1M6S379_PARC5|nr:stage IV sporulation protein A [Paramaledivibacter caminithermalis]SHK39304.1 stage IV sporulation protein A [Paramaledivibacter caminithermalis DSM 15212]